MSEAQAETKAKAPKPVRTLAEKRKVRAAQRKERRKALKARILSDAEFRTKYFDGKSTRSIAKTTAFKKAKSGKK